MNIPVTHHEEADPGAVRCQWCGAGRFRWRGVLLCRACDGFAWWVGRLYKRGGIL